MFRLLAYQTRRSRTDLPMPLQERMVLTFKSFLALEQYLLDWQLKRLLQEAFYQLGRQ